MTYTATEMRVQRLAENERCAQRCENMVAHLHHFDPGGKLSKAELLTKCAELMRAGEYGPLDMSVVRHRQPLSVASAS